MLPLTVIAAGLLDPALARPGSQPDVAAAGAVEVRILDAPAMPDPFSPGVLDGRKDATWIETAFAVGPIDRKADVLPPGVALRDLLGKNANRVLLLRYTWRLFGENGLTIAERSGAIPLESPIPTVLLPLPDGGVGEFLLIRQALSWDGHTSSGEIPIDGTYPYTVEADLFRTTLPPSAGPFGVATPPRGRVLATARPLQESIAVDDTAPGLIVGSPEDGSTQKTSRPSFRVAYSDEGSGIDPTEFSADLDGSSFSSRFEVAHDSATYDPGPQEPLLSGLHAFAASIRDVAGNETSSRASFLVMACFDDLVQSVAWPSGTSVIDLPGRIEFGQTHVIGANEWRLAPPLIPEREAMLLFTPDTAIPDSTPLILGAWSDGQMLGTLVMAPPARLPPALEAGLTSVPLAPYSASAWSVNLPWSWVREGVELVIRASSGPDAVAEHRHALNGLGDPHRVTITRSKIVLFGDEGHDATTLPATRFAADYFGSLPAAELRVVDSLPWILHHVVVTTITGPQVVGSESERRAVALEGDHGSILDQQMARRLNLANTGRGLVLTDFGAGGASPYSIGTSVTMGWFKGVDGTYRDISDSPAWLGRGGTGFVAMGAQECGNLFIHEVGHSFTLQHFTTGTAAVWGIADEYPQDGVNLASHPWGFDNISRRFRTWYRVGLDGPVTDSQGALVGKRDPQNGGESANLLACYPQHTAYHAKRIQDWLQTNPTILEIDGVPGVYRWSGAAHGYLRDAVDLRFEEPVAVDVPVATFIGTLGNAMNACQTYPPVYSPSGNLFTLPHPLDPELPWPYHGARWFLRIDYEDGVVEAALIARGLIHDASFGMYSLNVDASRTPVRVGLFLSPIPYPAIDLENATLVHELDVPAPTGPYPPIVRVGHGEVAAGKLLLTDRCEPGINCDRRRATSRWRIAEGQLTFRTDEPSPSAPTLCSDAGAYSVLRVPVRSDSGTRTEIVVHAQRVVSSWGHEFAVPMSDETPWIARPDVEQSLRAWLPWDANAALAPGRYRTDGVFIVGGFLDGREAFETPIEVDLEVMEETPVDLASEFQSAPLSTPDSSMYFLARDSTVGPTVRVWWDDGIPGAPILRVPVIDTVNDSSATLLVEAQNEENSMSRYDLHAGRTANGLPHRVILRVAAEGNESLLPGHAYATPPSGPLVIDARRWHDPERDKRIGSFAFKLTYTPPNPMEGQAR